MKNILLIMISCLFFVGCKSVEPETNLTDAQRNYLTQFASAAGTALQAMDANSIYNRSGKSMPKAIADEVRNCVKTPNRDGSGRLLGVTVNGALCPIRAQWIMRPNGKTTSSIDLSYRSQDDDFTQLLPVTILTLDGSRSTVPAGSQYHTTVTYRGSARDTSDDTVSFDATIDTYSSSAEGALSLPNYTYTIRVTFRDFSAEGKIVDNSKFYLNSVEISRNEFENLFFILK